MPNVIIQGLENLEAGFKNMIAGIEPEMEFYLDGAAIETQAKMIEETPKGIHRQTGPHLAETVNISAPNVNTRIIEPEGKNFSGNKYAFAVEEGSSGGRLPNIESIAAYYGTGLDKKGIKLAYAIALGIKKRGTPPHYFVARTYEWVRGMMEQKAGPFLENITARFAVGAI